MINRTGFRHRILRVGLMDRSRKAASVLNNMIGHSARLSLRARTSFKEYYILVQAVVDAMLKHAVADEFDHQL